MFYINSKLKPKKLYRLKIKTKFSVKKKLLRINITSQNHLINILLKKYNI